jgi:hypothetical protein
VTAPDEVIVVAGGELVCVYPVAREVEAGSVALVMAGANLDVVCRRMPAQEWDALRVRLVERGLRPVVNDMRRPS